MAKNAQARIADNFYFRFFIAPMKILGLQAQNFKRLKAVNIHPQGHIVPITGRNGQGKSSVIDAIWSALGGGDVNKEIPMPIRAGEASAEVRIDLGEVTVSRKWTSNETSYLKLEGKEGAMKSPQTVLDEWVSDLTFDPLAFSRKEPKVQREILIKSSNIDMSEVERTEEARETHYNERTLLNREIRNIEGQLTSLPHVENPPSQEISISEASQEMIALQSKLQECTKDKNRFEEMGRQIDALTKERATLIEKWKEFPLQENTQRVELLTQLIENAEEGNARFRAYQDRVMKENQLMQKKAEAEKMTTAIDQFDQHKITLLSNAKMPLAGLTIDEEMVYFNGTPFTQLSSAEQLRVSVAIAMSKNPTLRILLIKDGSLLDPQSLELLRQLAEERDYQIWIEIVDTTQEVGIVIEEGLVLANNQMS